ncbi:NUDIX domain-containing protein [Niallia sp. 03133]
MLRTAWWFNGIGESFEENARREVKEETGLTIHLNRKTENSLSFGF